MKAGDSIQLKARPVIEQKQLNAYAQASGDHNPIHLDAAAAVSMGLPGIIAHGMISAAFLAERATEALEESGVLNEYVLKKFECRFKSMVFLGDVISIGGIVKSAAVSPGDRLVLDLQATKQSGETVTVGSTEWAKR